MKKTYDVLVIGPVSLDHNIDYQGNERKEVGGAVVASGFAAAKSGNRTAVFTKLNPADADVEERFAGSGADVYWKPSQATCSIRNQYFTADKEKRACTSMGVCDPFRFDELPAFQSCSSIRTCTAIPAWPSEAANSSVSRPLSRRTISSAWRSRIR